MTPALQNDPPAPPVAPAANAAGPQPRRWGLGTKTMIGLMAVLITAVAICGLVVCQFTARIVEADNRRLTKELAYGIAAGTGDANGFSKDDFQRQIAQLQKRTEVRFAALIDMTGKVVAVSAADPAAWNEYYTAIPHNTAAESDDARRLILGEKPYCVATVPYFTEASPGKPALLLGRIHLATSAEGAASSLRFIQGTILLTCMAVVLVSVPVAALISRHITIPIKRLAGAAHRFAEGAPPEPVTLKRTDELGELADAFNRMTHTVVTQQADIRRINSGLESAVKTRTQELERVNHRLHAEIAEKEDFLRAVSHDLNAPLRNIAGMASMLLLKYQAALEPDAVQRLERIQKNVQVEVELLNELLELSRIKSRREKFERVDLHALIQMLTEQFSSDLETHGITLTVDGRLPVMTGERARLRQAFQNLIDNAIKYMRPDGPREIKVSAKKADGDWVISVRDTGMGIPPEDMPLLFHVFRRAKNASVAKIPGKGVGLASVKSIVDNYGGRMWADSTPGEGTTFHIAIPLSHFDKKHEVAA